MQTKPTEKKDLIANSFFEDERVIEAKKLLHEALEIYQKKITGIQPPKKELKKSYLDAISDFSKYRGASLWFPYIGSGFGKGPFVELADGSVKYDFICGIGAHYWGHNHPDLLDSSIDAALCNTIMQGNLQQNQDSIDLSALLVKASKLDHCFIATSGAMANENALKIAFQKRFPAKRILAFERCFVGRSLVLSQISDKPIFREGLPSNVFVDYIPFFDPKRPDESTAAAISALKKHISRYPNEHALMCFELIQGEGGFYSGTQEFYKALMTILKQHQIAIFADEVQSFARSSELFAYQYFKLSEFIDIVSIGKVSQVCATLFTEEYKPRPGLLSQTFTASTSAIKASLVIINGLLSGGYFGVNGKIAKLHAHFVMQLEALSKRYPDLVQGPFGIGCMIAITPYGGDNQKVTQFVHRLFDAGVISFVAGGNPTRTRFLIPAGALNFEDIDQVVKIIEKTLLASDS